MHTDMAGGTSSSSLSGDTNANTTAGSGSSTYETAKDQIHKFKQSKLAYGKRFQTELPSVPGLDDAGARGASVSSSADPPLSAAQ